MVVIRRLLLAAGVVGFAAGFVAASITSQGSGKGEQAQHRQSVTSLSAAPVSPTPSATSSTSTRTTPVPHSAATGSAAQKSGSPNSPLIQAVPQPAGAGLFSLVIKTQSGDISAQVAAISVASNQPVDPPHDTAQQWNTAVWVQESSYPSAPSRGTSYVYGHACHYHVCPFTRLKDAQIGDLVDVTTHSGVLAYRIERTGLSPKSASSLPAWASDSTVPNRLVLVTCEFEQGDTSINNIVLVGRLITGTT